MKALIISILALLLIGWGYFHWKYNYTYSEGNRSGLLQKFSHKGNLFKTYEGELVLNSLTSTGTNPISAEKFYFSVDKKTVAEKLMGVEGQRVILHYEEKNGAVAWRGDSKYIVDSVKVLIP